MKNIAHVMSDWASEGCVDISDNLHHLFRIHLFSIFTIKTPRALASLAPLVLLIVKTLTHVL